VIGARNEAQLIANLPAADLKLTVKSRPPNSTILQ